MQTNKKQIIIVGATSAIAEQCARIWLSEEPTELILIGRDAKKTEALAIDLRLRGLQSEVRVITVDFFDIVTVANLVDKLCADRSPDIVLIAHGALPDQAACQKDLVEVCEALEINGMSPALFAEGFAGHMERHNAGTLALISSVAGDRGRKSNYVYGAAKGLITRYAQGLQHRFAGTNVKVVLIKPGPTATPMTAHLPQQGLASSKSVARRIVNAIRKGRPVVYAPGRWAVIMMVIRHLPAAVFNKLDI